MIKTLRQTPHPQAEIDVEIPPFEPHPWLRGGHAQTIAGRYWLSGKRDIASTAHVVDLDDGDRLSVLESLPGGWSAGDPVAVLVHGLAGCARSPYIVRFAYRLVSMGVGVVRMNLRGAGSGFGLARGIYHAGRSDDLRQVVTWLAGRASGSPIALAGFSLGANLVLKLAAESADDPPDGLDCVLAANPPIDLASCARAMSRAENRLYDWNFTRWLRSQAVRLHRVYPDLGDPGLRRVSSVYEFDDRYTAARNGFRSADDYYARSSSLFAISRIEVPGLVVHAADDPFIPVEPFLRVSFPTNLKFELLPHGGHLGYISRCRWQGDRRWLEARLAAWLAARWGLPRHERKDDLASRDEGLVHPGVMNNHV
jgi:predicted alpha/beta-fold hydrolase